MSFFTTVRRTRSYVFLGDCVSTGIYAPPPSIVVLRDSDPVAMLTDSRPPKLARPTNYIRVRGAGASGRGAAVVGTPRFGTRTQLAPAAVRVFPPTAESTACTHSFCTV